MIFTYMSYIGFFRKNVFIEASPSAEETINHLHQDLLPSMGVSTKNQNTLKLVSMNKALDLSCQVTPHKKGSMIELKGDWKAQSYLMYAELILLMIGLSTIPKNNAPFMSLKYFMNSATSAFPIFLILTALSMSIFYVMKENEKSVNHYLQSSLETFITKLSN